MDDVDEKTAKRRAKDRERYPREAERRRQNARRYNQENRERILATLRERRKTDGDSVRAAERERYRKNPAAKLASTKEWHARNPEKTKAANAAWYAANKHRLKPQVRDPIKRREISQRYYRNHLGEARARSRAQGHRRRAQQRDGGNNYTPEQIDDLLLKQHGKCAECKTKLNGTYHIDHIRPLVLEGSNGIENIQLLCPRCNLQKGGKDPIEFARRKGRLL